MLDGWIVYYAKVVHKDIHNSWKIISAYSDVDNPSSLNLQRTFVSAYSRKEMMLLYNTTKSLKIYILNFEYKP